MEDAAANYGAFTYLCIVEVFVLAFLHLGFRRVALGMGRARRLSLSCPHHGEVVPNRRMSVDGEKKDKDEGVNNRIKINKKAEVNISMSRTPNAKS